MFEIKKKEYVNKTFRMPVTLVKQLEILAQNNNVSLNNLIIQCCEYAMENLDKSGREKVNL
ncbi:MAG: hypothetical protein ACI4A5_04980 [Hominilimicola sp.]